jgi:hypothetical protein
VSHALRHGAQSHHRDLVGTNSRLLADRVDLCWRRLPSTTAGMIQTMHIVINASRTMLSMFSHTAPVDDRNGAAMAMANAPAAMWNEGHAR